jgi:hypothetical protein
MTLRKSLLNHEPLASALVTMCAWCRRIRQDGAWVFAPTAPPQVGTTHGICDDCLRREFRLTIASEHPALAKGGKP